MYIYINTILTVFFVSVFTENSSGASIGCLQLMMSDCR